MKQTKLPLILSNEIVVFPHFIQIFDVGRKESLSALRESIATYGNKLLITPRLGIEDYGIEHGKIAILVEVINVGTENSEGTVEVTVKGLKRVELMDDDTSDLHVEWEYLILRDLSPLTDRAKKAKKDLLRLFRDNAKDLNLPVDAREIEKFADKSPSMVADAFSHIVLTDFTAKTFLLEEMLVPIRLEILINTLRNSIIKQAELSSSDAINNRVKDKLTQQQKEFYLKEKMKAIQDELDDIQGNEGEIETWRKQINSNPYPEHFKAKLLKEIKKLENTPSQAAEANVIRQYIETLIDLPFWTKDPEVIDIAKVKKQLNKDHYGLVKPKERIIEYLAVKQNNADAKGPILSLVGPPGTGKTTLAKSIADSLGRKFVKISLGGIRDEAEIRGHRRTYIAAMPGKIMTAMKKAGVTNPVILLDEIDKMSSDFKGDPTSAMLEVLDFEQNKNFQDHYIEEDYDLSDVMFIATANYVQNIPEALYDRLEMVELSSYTELEKVEIAKKHLIPNTIADTKIAKTSFKWSDKTIKFIIQHYTIEAGVRQLRRTIDQVARKILVQQLSNKASKGTITSQMITKLLGPEKFDYTKIEKKPEIGTVMGLAWTQYGGDILPIEVALFPGEGKLVLTGQLKDVMRESAGIALSYIKSNAKELNIDTTIDGKNIFKDFDIHVHSPDGATPKDGPSAGITFATALISILTKKPVSQFIGMTGEITLRGKVLPIGGLKEKSISAYRSGLKKILIPVENKKDILEIPMEVRKNLEIVTVKEYKDVFKQIFK